MQDKYYTISEAAELLGVTAMTLRNWEKSGKLVSERDESNGYRMYAADRILSLKDETSSSQDVLDLPANKVPDARGLRFVVRQLSKAYRDSQGGNLLERFEEISKLIFTKLHTENLAGDAERAFVVRADDTPDSVYERLNYFYHDAQKLLPADGDKETQDLKKDKAAVTACALILNKYELRKVPTDVKGFIYEELIKNTFDKTDNQQFFTPRTVVQFMVQFSQMDKSKVVMDPACGSGGFLISALPHLPNSGRIIGLEIDPMMAWIAQMNLVMNGAKKPDIHRLGGGGSLSHSSELAALVPQESVDLIITNPPFGSDFSDPQELRRYELGNGRKNRRRGVLFIERCIEWLKPGGKLAIVIDDGVLNGDGNADVRRLILNRTVVEAVISLPESAFMPYATVKASILLLRKKNKKTEPQGSIFMASAQTVGRKPNGDPLYSLDKSASGEPLLINDLPGIFDAWKAYKATGSLEESDQIFLANIDTGSDSARLDLPFYHPMRHAAQQALDKARYQTYKLGELVSVRNVSAVPALQDPDEKWRFIGLADITSKTGRYAPQELLGTQLKSSVKLYKSGDILFSKMRPELQKCCFISLNDDEGYTSAENIVLSVATEADQLTLEDKPRVLGEYLALILRSELGLGQILHQITGVGRPRIGVKTLLGIQIPLPPIEEQQRIIDMHENAWNKHLALKEKGENLIEESEEVINDFYAKTVDELVTR